MKLVNHFKINHGEKDIQEETNITIGKDDFLMNGIQL